MDSGVHEINIAGVPLKLKSSHGKDTVDELVRLVDAKVKETVDRSPAISFQNALMIAALHIAEELVLLKKVARRELADIEKEAKQILSEIEMSPLTQRTVDQ